MQTKFWVRRIVLAVAWALAVSTWASIAHHLGGMPDLGLPLVLTTMTFILIRPTKRAVAADRTSALDSAVSASIHTA